MIISPITPNLPGLLSQAGYPLAGLSSARAWNSSFSEGHSRIFRHIDSYELCPYTSEIDRQAGKRRETLN